MRGVGNELAQALLRFGAGLKRSFDIVDHRVQRKTNIADLITRLGDGVINALEILNRWCRNQVLGADVSRSRRYLTQGEHFFANPLAADESRACDHNKSDDAFKSHQHNQRRVIGCQRQADDQCPRL